MLRDKKLNKIKQPKYIYFIICIASVLFIFGIIGCLILGASRVEKALKERFLVHVFLKEEASPDAKDELMNSLSTQGYVKSIKFKTKEQALAEWAKMGGENFIDVTNENFLPESIVINIKAPFVTDSLINKIKKSILSNEIVSDVQYPSNIFDQFEIIKKIVFYLFVVAFFLIIISLVILGYMIELIIFSNRFVIRTMTLVGASKNFISRPFELRAIINGFISAVIAILGIVAVGVYLFNYFIEARTLMDKKIFIIVFVIIMFLGVFISWLSTRISINRYLKAPLEKLY